MSLLGGIFRKLLGRRQNRRCSLSNEVLCDVFQYLSRKFLLKRVSRVGHRLFSIVLWLPTPSIHIRQVNIKLNDYICLNGSKKRRIVFADFMKSPLTTPKYVYFREVNIEDGRVQMLSCRSPPVIEFTYNAEECFVNMPAEHIERQIDIIVKHLGQAIEDAVTVSIHPNSRVLLNKLLGDGGFKFNRAWNISLRTPRRIGSSCVPSFFDYRAVWDCNRVTLQLSDLRVLQAHVDMVAEWLLRPLARQPWRREERLMNSMRKGGSDRELEIECPTNNSKSVRGIQKVYRTLLNNFTVSNTPRSFYFCFENRAFRSSPEWPKYEELTNSNTCEVLVRQRHISRPRYSIYRGERANIIRITDD